MTTAATRPFRARTVLQVLMVIMPWPIRRRLCSKILRWRLHPTSRIGLSIVDADVVVLAEGARIGHFTVIRDLRRLDMGAGSMIGSWNWITAARLLRHQAATAGILRIGHESAITSRHYIDCSGGLRLAHL